MNLQILKTPIEIIYKRKDLMVDLENDWDYLKNAFIDIEVLWNIQFEQIKKIKFIMLSEAPLWGGTKSYLYNPETKFTQFFYRNDLAKATGCELNDKLDFLAKLREIGFIILDLSPYALNTNDTSINYRSISANDYCQLVSESRPSFFEKKLKIIKPKLSESAQFFFRYTRVQKLFDRSITDLLRDTNLITTDALTLISQQGGGINRIKFKKLS